MKYPVNQPTFKQDACSGVHSECITCRGGLEQELMSGRLTQVLTSLLTQALSFLEFGSRILKTHCLTKSIKICCSKTFWMECLAQRIFYFRFVCSLHVKTSVLWSYFCRNNFKQKISNIKIEWVWSVHRNWSGTQQKMVETRSRKLSLRHGICRYT